MTTETGTEISKTVSGFVQEQMAINKQKKTAQAAKAKASGARTAIYVVVCVVLITSSAWFMMDRLRPPGFVKLMDMAENASSGTMTVTGKVKNLTPRTVSERAWVLTYVDNDKKTVAEADLVLKDLQSMETREWSLQFPSWKKGARLVVRKKE